jgi:hypothetical protein
MEGEVMRNLISIAVLSCAAVAHAESRTYRILPAALAPDCPNILAGGTITTDGTLGALTRDNILSMSVDIRLGTWQVERGKEPQFLDGSTTLDLTNATLLLEGGIQATPTGIFISTPPASPYQRPDFGGVIAVPEPDPNVVTYSVSLDGGDAHVLWSSVNLLDYGVNNFITVDSVPAGGAGLHFDRSGQIASVIPEPRTLIPLIVALASFFVCRPASRRLI